jgi:hypothetical protein
MGFLSDLLFGKAPQPKAVINKRVFDEFIRGKEAGLEVDDEIVRRAGEFGQSLFDQVGRNAAARTGRTTQNLTNRGLANTTVVNAAQRGNDLQTTQEMAVAKDQVLSNLVNALAGKKATHLTQFGQQPHYYDAARRGGILGNVIGGGFGALGSYLGRDRS